MEAVAVTFAVVLGTLLIMLVTGILCREHMNVKKTAFAAVVPVFPEDRELKRRIDLIERSLPWDKELKELIVLVNYGATTEQRELCTRFCDKRENVIFTDPGSLEKILSKTFAIESKT